MTGDIENFDFKAGFEHLQDVVEEQRKEICDLNKVREKQERKIEYLEIKTKQYELVIKTIEAFTGRNIISD